MIVIVTHVYKNIARQIAGRHIKADIAPVINNGRQHLEAGCAFGIDGEGQPFTIRAQKEAIVVFVCQPGICQVACGKHRIVSDELACQYRMVKRAFGAWGGLMGQGTGNEPADDAVAVAGMRQGDTEFLVLEYIA